MEYKVRKQIDEHLKKLRRGVAAQSLLPPLPPPPFLANPQAGGEAKRGENASPLNDRAGIGYPLRLRPRSRGLPLLFLLWCLRRNLGEPTLREFEAPFAPALPNCDYSWL